MSKKGIEFEYKRKTKKNTKKEKQKRNENYSSKHIRNYENKKKLKK